MYLITFYSLPTFSYPLKLLSKTSLNYKAFRHSVITVYNSLNIKSAIYITQTSHKSD